MTLAVIAWLMVGAVMALTVGHIPLVGASYGFFWLAAGAVLVVLLLLSARTSTHRRKRLLQAVLVLASPFLLSPLSWLGGEVSLRWHFHRNRGVRAAGGSVARFSRAIVLGLFFASASFARDAQFGPAPRAADPGIAGINLYDPGSTLSVLGPRPPRAPAEGSPEIHGFPGRELTFVNAPRTEQLVLYVPPGAINLSVYEARVAPAVGEHPVFPGQPPTFVTSRGIKLGLSQSEVIAILGPPHTISPEELRYRIEREAAREWLAEFNLPYYEASYRFTAGRLSSFSFGFPVP